MSLIVQFAIFCRQKATTDPLGGANTRKQKNLTKTYEDKVLKNEASEKDSALQNCCLWYKFHLLFCFFLFQIQTCDFAVQLMITKT